MGNPLHGLVGAASTGAGTAEPTRCLCGIRAPAPNFNRQPPGMALGRRPDFYEQVELEMALDMSRGATWAMLKIIVLRNQMCKTITPLSLGSADVLGQFSTGSMFSNDRVSDIPPCLFSVRIADFLLAARALHSPSVSLRQAYRRARSGCQFDACSSRTWRGEPEGCRSRVLPVFGKVACPTDVAVKLQMLSLFLFLRS